MKKLLSIVLSVCLLLALVVIPTNAGYVYEHDKSNNFSFEIDFEEGSHTMYYAFWQGLITWKVNRDFSYSYYPGGYGHPGIADNPLKGQGSEGVSNTSVYALKMERASNQGWAESGGQVMNVSTADGYSPIILQNGVTYRLSFDYFVESNYITTQFKDQDGNMKTNSGEDKIIIGYGYNISGTSNPIQAPLKTIDTIYSYNKSRYSTTQFKGDNGTTRKIGNWYHAEYTFTPTGLTEFDYNATGDITAESGAPFLIMYHTFRYGASVYFDNIKVSQQVKTNVNPMGGTAGTGYVSGFCGDEIKLDGAVNRFGYEIDGWYYDGAYTKPVENSVFSPEMHNSYIYPKWKRADVIDFENYSSQPNFANGTRFAVVSKSNDSSTPTPKSGSKVMRFMYSSLSTSNYNAITNRFAVKPIGEVSGTQTFRITFWLYYYGQGGNVNIYPVLGTSSTNVKGYTDNYKFIGESSSGTWKKHTIYVDISESDVATYSDNLSLCVHATASSASVRVYIDDVKVERTNGAANSGDLTVNAGEGTIEGAASSTVTLDYGTSLLNLDLVNGDKFVEGFYKDSALTQAVTTFDSTLNGQTVYVKWTNTDNLEDYKYEDTLKNGFTYGREFSNSGRYALKAAVSGNSVAVAGIKKAEKKATYLVSFKYFAPAGTNAKISAGTVEFDGNQTPTVYDDFAVKVSAASGGWKEATVAYTENAAKTGNIVTALFVTPLGNNESTVYIDDVTVTKVADTEGFVIYDSMSHDGTATYNYGAKQTALKKPTAVLDGYKLNGWYTNENCTTLFAGTVITGKTKVYIGVSKKTTAVAGDINADGALNSSDYAVLKKYVLGIMTSVSSAADMNQDGKVNAVDLALMRGKIN